MKKLILVVEKYNHHFWGRVEDAKNFFPTGQGITLDNLIANVKEAIEDYLDHEGKEDLFWKKVNPQEINFKLHYDLQAFFEEHDYLNISAIAKRAGMNPGLLRQYASGVKYPSSAQAQKIESAIHQLAKELSEVSLYAG